MTLEKSAALQRAEDARKVLENIAKKTPLSRNTVLSREYGTNIYLKREDLQMVRSYKIRGAYNKIYSLSDEEKQKGVVCASAGNHAQGVAFSCHTMKIFGKIFMPVTTPKQKIKQVQLFGDGFVEIVLSGDTFDDAYAAALADSKENGTSFIHPFDDEMVIAGQATIALEILEEFSGNIDFLLVPVGGGGLLAGLVSVFTQLSPQTKIIAVEPKGAASMKAAIEKGEIVNLPKIDKFVDGAAVREVGRNNFEMVKDHIYRTDAVHEGKVCTEILKMYNEQAIVLEPAGALSIAALDDFRDEIKDKNVVCIISGSNNDIERTEEIKEKSLLFEGLKHYFMIEFPQRPGALKFFVNDILGENDDITYFQFSKKNSKEMGPAVVGVELKFREDFDKLKTSLDHSGFSYSYLNDNLGLFNLLI